MKSLACSALLLFAFSLNAQAPTAVPIRKEPHHHLVLENEYVRVFRVSIPGHDATLLHQHDVPYIYVSIGPADVINAVQGKPEAHIVMADGQVGYSPGHFAHIARTDAGSPFNNVTIELLKPQGEPKNLCTTVVPGAVDGGCKKSALNGYQEVSSEPQFGTENMVLELVHLGPETTLTTVNNEEGSLLVVLDNSEVRVEVKTKPRRTLHGGEVIWLRHSQGLVSNPGKQSASYLELMLRDNPKRGKR